MYAQVIGHQRALLDHCFPAPFPAAPPAAALTVLWAISAAADGGCERRPAASPVPVFYRGALGAPQPSYGVDAKFDEQEGSVIVIDSRRVKRLPWMVREFEIARQCVLILKAESLAGWNPEMRYHDREGYEDASRRLRDSLRELSERPPSRRTDCEALERLRRNKIIGYKELRELADFYANRFPDFPAELTVYRAKNLLSCSRAD